MCIDFIRHGNGYDIENVTVTVTVTVIATGRVTVTGRDTSETTGHGNLAITKPRHI